jgi:uncharacterized protein (TIGR03083 family)
VTDDGALAGLDPYAALDAEAARLAAFFAALDERGWAEPTRCEGWTNRDMLGHLAAAEEYHAACFTGTVAELLRAYGERGARTVDDFNALGVADWSAPPAADVLAAWADASARSRASFRERADGTIDSSIGEYPNRWQAFHVASELATHADDVGAAVGPDEQAARLAWRVGFSRFALAEAKPGLAVTVADGRTLVSDGTTQVELTDDDLVDGVMGRLGPESGFSPEARALPSTQP